MKKLKLIIIAILIPLYSFAQNQEANTLNVTGTAEIEVIPDMFQFDLRFTVTTGEMKKSIDDINAQMDRMIKAITRKTSISSDSIKTLGFNTYVNDNRYDSKKKTTYTANQALQLKIKANSDDITYLLNIIADENSSVNINTHSFFSNQKKTEVEEQLINAAFNNARHQANLLANAGNFEIGNVRSVNYTQGTPFQTRMSVRMESMQMDSAKERSFGGFNLDTQTMSKRIDISFYIYPKNDK